MGVLFSEEAKCGTDTYLGELMNECFRGLILCCGNFWREARQLSKQVLRCLFATLERDSKVLNEAAGKGIAENLTPNQHTQAS